MNEYNNKDKLKLTRRVYVTSKVYTILRKEKVKQKISMAKITCNLILKHYGYPLKHFTEEDFSTEEDN